MRGQQLTSLVIFMVLAGVGWCDAQTSPSGARPSIAGYVNSQPLLQIADPQKDVLAYEATSSLRAGRNLGLGSCLTGTPVQPKLYTFIYKAAPAEACGSGWFSDSCKAAWRNCIATSSGIVCDYDYLTRLLLLRQVVLSRHQSNVTVKPHIVPTDAMLLIARITEQSLSGKWQPMDVAAFDSLYPWSNRHPADGIDRLIADVALLDSVVWHELSHVEQSGCGLGQEDARFAGLRDVLEQISCRTLTSTEMRADLKALDAEAVAAGVLPETAKDEPAATLLYLEALAARLEYEAMVLPNPQYAVTMYAAEPKDSAQLWNHYFDAGANFPTYTGSGHIPPELRPIAALWMLNSRGFMKLDGNKSAFTLTTRLRPFLTGLLWSRCKRQFNAIGVRDAMYSVMFDMEIRQISELPTEGSKPPGYYDAAPSPSSATKFSMQTPAAGRGERPGDPAFVPAVRHAVDLGVGASALFAAFIQRSREGVQKSYGFALEQARALEIDLPLPPGLADSSNGEITLDRSAEGVMYTIGLSGKLGESIYRKHGSYIAAAFQFSILTLIAHIYPEAREDLLDQATGAASILQLPMETVNKTFQAVHQPSGEATKTLLRQLDAVVEHCREMKPES